MTQYNNYYLVRDFLAYCTSVHCTVYTVWKIHLLIQMTNLLESAVSGTALLSLGLRPSG